MFYEMTRQEIKTKNGTDFKQNDIIKVGETYEIEIDYGNYSKPSLCSKVFDLAKNKYQDVVFRPDYIRYFLSR